MGTSRNTKLSVPMSPCLRLFIESLLNEVDLKSIALWHQTSEFQPPLLKVLKPEHELAT